MTTENSRADALTVLQELSKWAAGFSTWQDESKGPYLSDIIADARRIVSASTSSQPAAAPADLQGLRRSILTSREIVRDQDGMLSHPAVPYLDEDVNYETFFAAFGIEATFIHMEDDVDCDTYDRYFASNSPDCCTWTPSSPQGDGWMLLEIYDTEDGPVALYVREKKPESMRERWKREKRESDAAAPSPADERAAERALSQTIDERDQAAEDGTCLANAVGEFLDVDVGEWSSANNPIRAAIEALESYSPATASESATITAGWQLVPTEVTNAMIDAANATPGGIAGSPPHWQWVWDAMLAAAPQPPTQADTIQCQAHSGPNCTECGGTGVWPAQVDVRARLATKEQVELFAASLVKHGELTWCGFRKDTEGKYTIPVLPQPTWKLIDAILKMQAVQQSEINARAASANETGAEGTKTEAEIRKTMMLEQIRLERKLTCEAIDGAMAFGYQNTNPPPSADHWLAPYWKIGRKQYAAEFALRYLDDQLTEYLEGMPADETSRNLRDIARNALVDIEAATRSPAMAAEAVAIPADGACKRCGSTTAQACNDAGCFYLESGDGEPSAAPADERTASFEAWCDRFPEISAVERLRDAWQEARAALPEDRIDWIANTHCPGGTAYPVNVKNAIREALREARISDNETEAQVAQQLSAEIAELKIKLVSYEREREDQIRYLAAQSEEIADLKQQLAHADARVGLTAEARVMIMDACQSISRRADEIKESNASADGTWCDADEKAFYYAELSLLERLVSLLATTQQPRAEVTDAARDVLDERHRQIDAEGWTPAHDDEHDECEMALAAIVYTESAVGYHPSCPDTWPWSPKWFKPPTPRRDLVKAVDLVIAEIERLDRAATRTGGA